MDDWNTLGSNGLFFGITCIIYDYNCVKKVEKGRQGNLKYTSNLVSLGIRWKYS